MLRFRLGLLLLWAVSALANDNLRVAYEWREMDFKYASPDQKWSAIERGEFKPANVIPFGLEVAGHRLFVTLPRWRDGVPASLAYLDLNGKRLSCIVAAATVHEFEYNCPMQLHYVCQELIWDLKSRISDLTARQLFWSRLMALLINLTIRTIPFPFALAAISIVITLADVISCLTSTACHKSVHTRCMYLCVHITWGSVWAAKYTCTINSHIWPMQVYQVHIVSSC